MREILAKTLRLLGLLRYLHRRKMIILLYHGFTQQNIQSTIQNYEDFAIDIETFEKHLTHLTRNYNIVSLEHLMRHYVRYGRPPSNSLVITIDDGYESAYTLAYPVLKRHNVPATLFVVTESIEKEEEMLKWNQLIEMVRTGLVSVGSHTCTHPLLTRCSPAKMKKELLLSKQTIERKIGDNCRFFAYPYGTTKAFDQSTMKFLEELGYSCGITCIEGMNDEHSNLLQLRRLDVSSEDDLERRLRHTYIKDSPLLFTILRTSFAFLNSLSRFRRRVYYGYWLRNWIECEKNRRCLRKIREDLLISSKVEKPLVSVIVPTYNRGRMLVERAIPSVLNQTYQNFEVIVVGDHCTDDTPELIQKINDKRVRFHNLKARGNYPRDNRDRKMVAGVTPSNKALDMCRGEWITRLDDDDEFSKDHIEVLLDCALENGYELVYGRVEVETRQHEWIVAGSYPPRYGEMAHIGALYSSKLKFFRYNIDAWKYVEPDDWNYFRRMTEAGVKIGFINRVVGRAYLGKRRDRLT